MAVGEFAADTLVRTLKLIGSNGGVSGSWGSRCGGREGGLMMLPCSDRWAAGGGVRDRLLLRERGGEGGEGGGRKERGGKEGGRNVNSR